MRKEERALNGDPLFLISHINSIIGNLFYRGISPGEIKGMDFLELEYWNSWHEKMAEAEKGE